MIADAPRHFNRVVGIDLGGGKGKHTAVAIGDVTPTGLEIRQYGTRTAEGMPYYDHVLCKLLADQPPRTLVAMDAHENEAVAQRVKGGVLFPVDGVGPAVAADGRADVAG